MSPGPAPCQRLRPDRGWPKACQRFGFVMAWPRLARRPIKLLMPAAGAAGRAQHAVLFAILPSGRRSPLHWPPRGKRRLKAHARTTHIVRRVSGGLRAHPKKFERDFWGGLFLPTKDAQDTPCTAPFSALRTCRHCLSTCPAKLAPAVAVQRVPRPTPFGQVARPAAAPGTTHLEAGAVRVSRPN